ncbi:hypothetical protein D3C87_1209870 [compost metagenome]
MSAPNYDDPKTKLKLRLRPMSGSYAMLAWGSVLSGLGAALCFGGFVVSFVPGVQGDGSPLWFLVGAGVFAGGAGFFYLAHKLVRRLH